MGSVGGGTVVLANELDCICLKYLPFLDAKAIDDEPADKLEPAGGFDCSTLIVTFCRKV